jgi:hypothetical protein
VWSTRLDEGHPDRQKQLARFAAATSSAAPFKLEWGVAAWT